MPRIVTVGVAVSVVFALAFGLGTLSSGETTTGQATEFDVSSDAPGVSDLRPRSWCMT